MTLFITAFLEDNYNVIYKKLELVLVMWLIVFIAITIDLVSGVYKAIQIGEARTSQGFKRTIDKLLQYYGLLCFALMFDILASIIEPLPYMTAIVSLFLVFIEAKSVFEKAHDKDRRRMKKEIDTLITLLENKGDIKKALSEIIKKEKEKEDKNGTDK